MTHPHLDRLLADVDAPVRRVVLARGVEAHSDGNGGWHVPNGAGPHHAGNGHARPSAPSAARRSSADETLAALGLRPVTPTTAMRPVTPPPAPRAANGANGGEHADPVEVGAQHGLAPLLLVTTAPQGSETRHLVSAAGALGWRPPVERLFEHGAVGARARRLRFVLDALEYHAARSAECYAQSAAAARRTAALFGTTELTTLSGQTDLFVELDALLAVVQRTYVGAARLLAASFPARRARDAERAAPSDGPATFDALVLGARSAPADLRETLLAAWEQHGVHAAAYRRALRSRDAAELGHASVQLARLGGGVWAVSVPVSAPAHDVPSAARGTRQPRRRLDALERAWDMATDAMRIVSLVVFSITDT